MRRFTRVSVILVIVMAIMFSVGAQAAPARAGTMQTYIVLYKQQAVPSNAASVIANAGGTLVYSYSAIGVVIARSDNSSFRANLLRDKRVEGVSSTASFAVRVGGNLVEEESLEALTAEQLNASPIDDEPLGYLQWDMRQIHVPEAHAITTGSPSVLVGDLDTGLDWSHPDLAANVDFANSVSCEGGVPNQAPAAWMDHNGHGTHTAGTIAAADNGIGIVGVAPNVKIAGIKTSNDDGYFFPEAVVCAFMWAAEHGVDVTNNSYFADPWLFNCHNDAEQRAIWKAEQRAIRYAMSKGVVVVAAEGNFSDDLAHPTRDIISPDFPPGSEQEREVRNSCVVIPVEISGVIGVTANGYLEQKSYYSNYGVSVTQVVAPGGDRRFQIPPTGNGRVLSTVPGGYAYAQGTSMASPHVAGVAALIMSQGVTSPGAVAARISNTADPMACPSDMSIYANFPSVSNGAPQVCEGDVDYNSFNGHGQVNALNAVTHTTE